MKMYQSQGLLDSLCGPFRTTCVEEMTNKTIFMIVQEIFTLDKIADTKRLKKIPDKNENYLCGQPEFLLFSGPKKKQTRPLLTHKILVSPLWKVKLTGLAHFSFKQ